jgi:hypothetical protein
MNPHDSIASVSAIIIAVIIGVCMFLIVTKCHAWTEHEFQARLSGGNDWYIHSLPESICRSEEYDMAGKMGYLSYVYTVREDGKWDTELMYMGPIAMDRDVQSFAKLRIVVMMKAIDKILPDERMVVIMFSADYVEMAVWFEPTRWKNKEFHVKTAKKLNIERKKWKKLAITN